MQTTPTLASRIAAEVRAEIARQGLTAAMVADRSDISRASLSRKLSGRNDFTFSEAVRVCQALGVALSDLARRAEDAA